MKTSSCPQSLFFELMDFSVTLCSDRDIGSGELRINTQKYFEMLSKDKDEVIMLLNYFIEKGENNEFKHERNKPAKSNDGFWDF